MSDTSNTKRLNEVEIMLVHQEQKIEELSEVITTQWNEIEALKARLNHTNAKIQELEMSTKDSGEESANIRPPHY